MDRSKGQFQNYSSSFQHLTHHTSYLFFLKHFHLAASQDAHFNHWFSPNIFSLFRAPGQALLLLTSRYCSATGFSLWPSSQSTLMVYVGESAPVWKSYVYIEYIYHLAIAMDNHKTSRACKISVYYLSFWRGWLCQSGDLGWIYSCFCLLANLVYLIWDNWCDWVILKFLIQ